MMNFRNLKISYKLMLSFSAVVALLLVLAGYAFVQMQLLNGQTQHTRNMLYPKTVLAHTIKDELGEMARNMRDVLLNDDAAFLAKEYANIDESTAIIGASLDKIDKLVETDAERALLVQVVSTRKKFVDARNHFLELARERKIEEGQALLFSEVRPLQLSYFDELDNFIGMQEKAMDAASSNTAATVAQAIKLIIGLALAAVVFSVFITIRTSRSIVLPMQRAVALARKVADGDLSMDITASSTDETGQLLSALAAMSANLNSIVAEVREGTVTIANGSTEIAAGNLDLSSRTEQQASALEETASSMEEMTSTTRQNADNARQANVLASSACEIAERGGAVVAQVVTTMSGINDASRKIVDIISVIDGIAFQTNILALNAAVEAARAGEQGRGFAVVASEVRNLAQRSAGAAKEIKLLIGDTVERVNLGSTLVGQAGTTMDEVVGAIKRVADIMGDIGAASGEQEAGIEQINQAIAEMDAVTQQNAALVEQAAAVAASMQEQAKTLDGLVNKFVLRSATAQMRPTPPRQAPGATRPASRSLMRPALAVAGPTADWDEF
jgi:methyl-accepting chemotaxis protein